MDACVGLLALGRLPPHDGSSRRRERRADARAASALIIVALAACMCPMGFAAEPTGPISFAQDIHPILEAYCAKCHGPEKKKAGMDFSSYRTDAEANGARDAWRRSLEKITSMEMPPDTERQPEESERRRLVTWLRSMKRMDAPDPGDAIIRRLSAFEYRNTVRDLFATDITPGVELPKDSAGEGFDNTVSPLLMEKYLLSADDILDRLIVPEQLQRHFLAGQLGALIAGAADPGKADGKERRFSGPAEVTTLVDIPSDGMYTIRIKAAAEQNGAEPARLGVRFDSQVLAELKITARPQAPATYSCTAKLAAGRARMSIVFMNPMAAAPPAAPKPQKPAGAPKEAPKGKPGAGKKPETANAANVETPQARTVVIESIDVVGPPAKPMTDAQRKLFIAMPGADLDKREAARQIIEVFAYKAFRRPPYEEEVDGLLKVFDLADAQDESFTDAVTLMLKAVLVSPQFLFRTPEDLPTGSGIVPIGDHDLATRLSYFLWATMPDDELLRLAHEGRLRNKLVLEKQVRRLIKDPRSRALATTFASSWLGLDRFANAVVDERKFPQLTPALREDMYDEVMTFFESLMRDGGSAIDLLDCRYAWMNARTAKPLYGIDGIKGAKMQKVALEDGNRGGLVTMPAILLVTSRADRTSPVKRGNWVLGTLFGTAPPPPPPNVATLDKQDTAENAHLTLRQKTEAHRTDAACMACHRIMDPIGFGLENFDAIGRWRTKDDGGGIVDALGELPGGLRFASPADLKRIFLGRKDEFVRVFISKLLAFALGRSLSGYDETVVDQLVEEAARDHYELDEILVKLVMSYPFVNRRAIH